MGKRHGLCLHCNKIKRLTTHHIKNRLGDRVEYFGKNNNLKPLMMWLCRECHDIIEEDYILIGKTIR